MRFSLSIQHKGQQKIIDVTPELYKNKKVYQLNIDNSNLIIYKERNEWKHDAEHRAEGDLLQKIGRAIEKCKL